MSTLDLVALVALALIGAVLVIVAAIRLGREWRPAPETAAAGRQGPRWFEILLAAALLSALVILGVVFAFQPTAGGEASGGWRAGTRSDLFLGVMLVVAVLSLLFLLVVLTMRLSARSPAAAPRSEEGALPAGTVRDPAGSRLFGLLLLAAGILLLGWVYLDAVARADLMVQVLYPAAVAVGFVLLFDKATRSWTPKTRVEGFREWLLCDLLLIALILGFLNLRQIEDGDAYGGFFWDMVHIAMFFLVFWCMDRTSMRGRFLAGFGYLALLPLLLALWRWAQEIDMPPDPAWWSTLWPIFFLALAFFILEIITLLVLKDSRDHAIPAVKDALFVVLYAAFLIAAVPGTE